MATGKKKFNKVILYVILIVAILTAVAYLLLTGKNSPFASNNGVASTPTPNYELVQIVVASQSISRGSVITSDVLTTIRYPKTALPQGIFFLSIEDAVGTKAKYNIDPGVPLTTSMLIHEGSGSLASFDIPSGMTAYSIPASPETAVAYAPQKGDHVMVVGCMLLTDVDTNFQSVLPNNTTMTFAPGAFVEGLGLSNSSAVQPLPDGSTAAKGRYDQETTFDQLIYVVPTNTGIGQNYPGSVTLVVSPQDTIVLNYLLLSGAKLSMALKGAGDTAKYNTDPVTLQYIMDEKNIPSPVKLPYAIAPRVDTITYPSFNDYILLQP
jgi:hypothetical protein